MTAPPASRRAQVTVVIVTWNARDLVIASLDGLRRQSLSRDLWEVVVVDNDSSDGTAEALASHPLGVEVVRAPSNLGFAGGAHLGIGVVTTPHVVLVNDDAVPEPDFLAALLRSITAQDAHDVAAVTARVLLMPRFTRLPDGTPADGRLGDVETGQVVHRPDPDGAVDIVNSTGNTVDRAGYGRDRSWGLPDSAVDDPADVFAFCGAAVLLRMSALEAVGDFDPRLFLYYEDTDLSWRLRAAGWRVVYDPAAVVRHHHGASSDVRSSLFRFHDDRNRLVVLTKNAPAVLAARQVLRYPLTIASLTVHLGPRRAMTTTRVRALASYLRLLPAALRERRRIAASAAVTRQELAQLLTG